MNSILLLLLLAALAIPGLINRTRALLAGRKGIRFAQHLYDVRLLLLRKGAVYSTTASALFRAVPSVYLGSAIVAALFVPVGDLPSALSFEGDIIAFAYLMALGRVALILARWTRAARSRAWVQAAKRCTARWSNPRSCSAGTLALLAGYTSFDAIFSGDAVNGVALVVVLLLAAYVLVKIVFTEAGRVPVDDPRTHLELTMIHEAMCLDYGGADLGYIKMAGWLKTAALAMLAADAVTAALCPHWWAAAPLAVLLTGLSVGMVESTQARNKLARNTTFILTVAALAVLVFFTGYLLQLNIGLQ